MLARRSSRPLLGAEDLLHLARGQDRQILLHPRVCHQPRELCQVNNLYVFDRDSVLVSKCLNCVDMYWIVVDVYWIVQEGSRDWT